MIQNKIGDGKIILGQSNIENSDEGWDLSIGRAVSKENKEVELDSLSPHVIFVCGARGSGKSYTLGVIAEELAQTNSDIAAVIIDPIGVFWSMKYPNREEREIKLLKERGLEPEKTENLQVFIPAGYKSKVPKETFDTVFSFKPSNLKTEDWCLTFGIDRYSPQGLLLERATEKIKNGYTRKLGDKLEGGNRDVPPNEDFSIDDMLECINHDRELISKEKGFSGSTRRALTSRLTASKDWGIFGSEKKLSDLIKPGKISVIDISFLQKNIGSLVLGIFARKILSERKIAAREEAVRDMTGDEDRSSDSIPPTWLMIDEAHSFAPTSGNTAATDPLIEFVKQGRRPGLSAVLSTQQPSALNSKIISQLDILISHRLTFKNDIKEVQKRTPTTLPDDLKRPASLNSLPEGTAIIADEETALAFVASIRPRFSQHEGRERVKKTSDVSRAVRDTTEEREEEFEIEKGGTKDYSPKSEEEVFAVPAKLTTTEALDIAESERKRLFKVLWRTEKVRRISKYYYPIWSLLIDYYPESGKTTNLRLHMDALTGEVVRKVDGKLKRTNGVRNLPELEPFEQDVFFEIIRERGLSYSKIEDSFEKNSKVKTALNSLIEAGLVERHVEDETEILRMVKGVDIPGSLSEKSILAAEEIPDFEAKKISSDNKIDRMFSETKMMEVLEPFGDIEIIERELFYYPYWVAELRSDSENRILVIDAVFGERDIYAERMLRRRVE